MGFLDGLGGMLGKMAAQGQAIQTYKTEYETMSDQALLQLHRELKGRAGEDNRMRRAAIGSILENRGFTKQ